MTRPACARIDLAALDSNFGKIKALAPRSRIMAVVKADAYGHGAQAVAAALTEADGFAVASADEAVILRDIGVRQEICLLSGFFEPGELNLIDRYQLSPVIHCQEQIAMIKGIRFDRPGSCWIKVDSGMHRAGFPPHQIPKVYDQLAQSPGFKEIRFMSHLANSDDRTNASTRNQRELFHRACARYSAALSLANSAAVAAWPDTHLDWVRPGIMLYGCSPLLDEGEAALGLKPVMTLQSQIISIKDLNRGDAIGYGSTWTCPQDMRVGLVACGYGDGYPRHAPSGTPVWVRGKTTQLLGRVSMDSISIDLRPCARARVGDLVELWGANVTATEVARHAETISYELLTKVTSRVRRLHGQV